MLLHLTLFLQGIKTSQQSRRTLTAYYFIYLLYFFLQSMSSSTNTAVVISYSVTWSKSEILPLSEPNWIHGIHTSSKLLNPHLLSNSLATSQPTSSSWLGLEQTLACVDPSPSPRTSLWCSPVLRIYHKSLNISGGIIDRSHQSGRSFQKNLSCS